MTGATGKHTGAGASGEPQAAGDPAMTAPVPVLVITGPVGVGKSTIANETAWLLCHQVADRGELPYGTVNG
jgi:adenylylsulfate kinase-like enzyme